VANIVMIIVFGLVSVASLFAAWVSICWQDKAGLKFALWSAAVTGALAVWGVYSI
jgi:hypothetical protein